MHRQEKNSKDPAGEGEEKSKKEKKMIHRRPPYLLAAS
jgi:hypothetical protein